MAVRNEWADPVVEAGKRGNAALNAGQESVDFAGTFEIAAADSDGSIIKLARIPSNAIMVKLELWCDVITGCTSVDCGYYYDQRNPGDTLVEVDENILLAAEDISAGQARGSQQDLIEDLNVDQIGKKVWEVLGKTLANKEECYILALTFNTIGSGAGTVSYQGRYILG